MQINRIDLADIGSPAGLVTKILKIEENLPDKVPIEDLAKQLDIIDIKEFETEGFEGGLIIDDAKSEGIIFVAKQPYRQRRRFTIAHELGHFLIPTHKPIEQGKFLCKAEDMRRWPAKDQDAHMRMEVQANEFAALILVPPPRLLPLMANYRDANLLHVLSIAKHFDVSKEVSARSYAQYHDEAIATVVVHKGKIRNIYKNSKFPFMTMKNGDTVPKGSLYYRRASSCSDIQVVGSELWLDSQWGRRMPTLYEQVLSQQNDFALLLLWAELPDEDEEDPDEDKTAKQRYRDRQSNWRY